MKQRGPIVIGLLLLVLAPLAGGALRGLPAAFFEFPPVTQYVPHAPFSWPVFLLFLVAAAFGMLLLARPCWFGFRPPSSVLRSPSSVFRLPSWFWFGLVLNAVSWVCAWGRFDWLGPLKDHTFFTLWLGYILVMDALVRRRAGSSILSTAPRSFIVLFPASAVIWWYFEYLNRFVQNWWYGGVVMFNAPHYAWYATLCFSTVLPAILETYEWLSSFPWFRDAYSAGPAWKPRSRKVMVLVVALGVLGQMTLALWPNPFFFLTWVAPLAILAASLAIAGVKTPFDDLKRGDYRRLFTLAAAALVCGFFWEMWNYFSAPQWHYTVPYVGKWRVFEMPLPGYAGYLPFGPICWCLWAAAVTVFRGREPATPRC